MLPAVIPAPGDTRQGDLPGVRTGDLKRLLDLAIAVPALLLCAPVMLLLALAVRLESAGNPFFAQERTGYLGRTFTLFKLRTMYAERCGIVPGKEVRDDDDRLTRVGRFLRRLKLDELPQLVNVVLGQMTLVGPRPDLPFQAAAYTDFQRQRLGVPPGITGVAQISGSTWITWPQRIVLDVWYIQNWSLGLDLRVIWETMRVALRGERPDDDPFGLRATVLR